MTITYPLTHPTTPDFRDISWQNMAQVALTESQFSFASQVQEFDGQMWRATANLPPMTHAQAREWIAFLHSLNGRRGTFYFGDPDAKTPRGTAAGTPVVAGTQTVGSQVLYTSGWTEGTGLLLKGDMIQIGTGANSELHMVLNDVDADASPSGEAAIDIWPRIRKDPGDGTSVVTSNAVGVFRLANNQMSWDADEARIYGMTINVMEALSI